MRERLRAERRDRPSAWRCVELGANASFGAAAFAHVAVDAAVEADLIWGVDVDAEVVVSAQGFVVQSEDAFDDEEVGGFDGLGAAGHAVWVAKS